MAIFGLEKGSYFDTSREGGLILMYHSKSTDFENIKKTIFT